MEDKLYDCDMGDFAPKRFWPAWRKSFDTYYRLSGWGSDPAKVELMESNLSDLEYGARQIVCVLSELASSGDGVQHSCAKLEYAKCVLERSGLWLQFTEAAMVIDHEAQELGLTRFTRTDDIASVFKLALRIAVEPLEMVLAGVGNVGFDRDIADIEGEGRRKTMRWFADKMAEQHGPRDHRPVRLRL